MLRRAQKNSHLIGLVAVLVGAAALRVWNLDAWLPYGLLNPDENTVLPIAFSIGGGELNPNWFFYPTGLMYLVAGLWRVIGLSFDPVAFAVDPTSHYLAARGLVAAAGVAMVALAYRVGRPGWPGVLVAALVAVEGVAVLYSHMAVTDVPSAALATLALALALAAIRHDGPGSSKLLLGAAVAAGAGASIKYSSAAFLLPVLVAAIACGVRDPRRIAIGAGAAIAAFLALTPFALLDVGTFVSAYYRQTGILSGGWLGYEHIDNGWVYNLTHNLWRTLGPVAVVLAGAGIAMAIVRRSARDLVLVSAAVPYFLYVSTWEANFDRYLLPIVPPLAALAVEPLVALWRADGRRGGVRALARPLALALALVAVTVPAARALDEVSTLDEPDNRVLAMERIEREVPQGTAIALDPIAPPLLDLSGFAAHAARGRERPWYWLVRLPTPNPNPRETGPRPSVERLRELGVGWVLTSGGVRGRVEDAGEYYSREIAFYGELERIGAAWRQGEAEGPEITAYRLR